MRTKLSDHSIYYSASTMADLPPSYEEVVKNPPFRRDQPAVTPSAPPFENDTSTETRPQETQGQLPQSVLPNPWAQDDRFSSWDDRATKILIVNRLDMKERFDKARNQMERHLLWNVILNHLLAAGYDFARIDLMQYWKHIFSIYKTIVNSLYEGAPINTSWKYFDLIDNVFEYTTKRPRSTKDEDYDAVAVAMPGQPMFSIVHNGIHSEPLVRPPGSGNVARTRPTAQGYTPIAQSNNRNDDDDDDADICCCCSLFCWFCPKWLQRGCCADNRSAYIARAGRRNARTTARGTAVRTDGHNGGTVNATSDRSGGYTTATGGNSSRSAGIHTIATSRNRSRSGGYSSGTGGYTERTNEYSNYNDLYNNYNNTSNTNDYTGIESVNHANDHHTSRFAHDSSTAHNGHNNHHHHTSHSNDNHHRHTSHSNDNSFTDSRADTCHDSGRGSTNHHSSDTGGGGGSSSHHCSDTGGGTTSYSHSDTGGGTTSYSHSDTGGGTTSYSCSDTGGGGSTDYGCSDTGGGDYSCSGGNDD